MQDHICNVEASIVEASEQVVPPECEDCEGPEGLVSPSVRVEHVKTPVISAPQPLPIHHLSCHNQVLLNHCIVHEEAAHLHVEEPCWKICSQRCGRQAQGGSSGSGGCPAKLRSIPLQRGSTLGAVQCDEGLIFFEATQIHILCIVATYGPRAGELYPQRRSSSAGFCRGAVAKRPGNPTTVRNYCSCGGRADLWQDQLGPGAQRLQLQLLR
mmetsp:Transcript_43655/g.76520  ORF Transcript_43655/g.76520 Transcript_43655/m.76520 type:complete len:212 (-) Transcript_43655:198-833(-)